jgi:hypothetical protein
MSLYILPKERLPGFVDNLRAGFRVVGPVRTETGYAFDAIHSADELALDYPTTILPPKKYLLPQRETLFTFHTGTDEQGARQIDVQPAFEDVQPTVILGVHTCDMHGIMLYDKVFTEGYRDEHYVARREQTYIVGIECLRPCDDASFCKDMGTLTAPPVYDLHMTAVDGMYLIDTGTEKGERLLLSNVEVHLATTEDIRRLAVRMLAEGAAAEPLTELISSLNDHLTVRILELTRHEFELPKTDWCWLSFGSEGRYEQTLSTDQDNGILFAGPAGAAAGMRESFLPFARAVNERLAACGFPLCKGNIMASNPELCLSREEWKDKFVGLLRSGNPQALLDATIYFDFRPIYGDEPLADELRAWLLETTAGATLFLRFMAENALRVQPPLGMLRDFVFDKNEDYPHTLDLKASGSRLFVDVARILSLANRVGATSTAERLRALAERGKLGRDDIGAVIDGFYFVQQLRLREQQRGTPAGAHNRIDPDDLNELDRYILKEAFKQAKKLQSRLQLEYRL